jgi:hypothetical protein
MLSLSVIHVPGKPIEPLLRYCIAANAYQAILAKSRREKSREGPFHQRPFDISGA